MYHDFGQGLMEALVTLVAAPGPPFQVVLAVNRLSLSGAEVVEPVLNLPLPGPTGVNQAFRFPAEGGCSYALVGQLVAGDPTFDAVQVIDAHPGRPPEGESWPGSEACSPGSLPPLSK